MKEAIITLTVLKRVKLNPDNFDPGMTDEEMLAEEMQWAHDMPHEWMLENGEWTVAGKIVDEGGLA